MDLSKTFVTVDNSTEVEHPSGIKINLLPHGHTDAFRTMGLKMNLKRLETFEDYVRAVIAADEKAKAKQPKASDYFETGEELREAMAGFVAAHITGWSNVEDKGKAVAFTYEAARDLLTTYPAFGDWVHGETQRLAASKAETDAATEEKKSD